MLADASAAGGRCRRRHAPAETPSRPASARRRATATCCSTSRCASCGWWTISEIAQMPAHGTSARSAAFPSSWRCRRQCVLDDRAQRRLVLDPRRPVGKARVGEHVLAAEPPHQAGELPFGHHRQHQIAFAGLEAVAGELAGGREVAVLPVDMAGDGVFGDLAPTGTTAPRRASPRRQTVPRRSGLRW